MRGTRLQAGLKRWGPVGLLVLVLVGLPLAQAAVTGALSIPHNDAWSHARIARTFAETGQIRLVGWNRSALIGQVVVLGPLGGSVVAQHLFAVACGALALVLTYLLVEPRAGSRGALLAVVTLGVVPEFGLLTTSYMTDVPALAGALACLWLGDVAVRSDRPAALWASMAVGLWALAVREQALAAPAAVLLAAWLSGRPRRLHVVCGGAMFFVCALAFEVWRRSLPFDDPPGDSGVEVLRAIGFTARGFLTLGLYLLPITLVMARPAGWSRRVQALAVAAPVTAAALGIRLGASPMLGNYLGARAAYSAASYGVPFVMPQVVWHALIVVAVLGAGLLLGHLCHSFWQRDPLLLSAGALTLLGLVGQAAVGQGTFSRSLLLLVPIGAGLLLRRERAVRWGMVAAGVLLSYAIVLTVGTYAYDAARWRAAETLVADGVAATDIDAGMEWVGSHAPGPLRPGSGSWRSGGFEGVRSCYLISGRPLQHLDLVRTYRYRTWGLLGSSDVYIHRAPC